MNHALLATCHRSAVIVLVGDLRIPSVRFFLATVGSRSWRGRRLVRGLQGHDSIFDTDLSKGSQIPGEEIRGPSDEASDNDLRQRQTERDTFRHRNSSDLW